MNIAVLFTVHNRKKQTLASLASLFAQKPQVEIEELAVYLVDDGCTDGTPQAVAENFPRVIVIPGTGYLYWVGGMRMAFEIAMRNKGFDFYLWLNDDTNLYFDALERLVSTSLSLGSESIIVGSTHHPETGCHTYGGVRRSNRWRPLKFIPLIPGNTLLQADTMNGNCVLIPRRIAHTLGNLDPVFTHRFGDFDYGLRARQFNFDVIVAKGYIGTCKRNDLRGSWMDPSLLPLSRLQKVITPIGFPPREWAIFAKRYSGFFWPVYWVLAYRRVIFP